MIGIWRLTDTRFTPFLFPNHPVLVYFLSLSMLNAGNDSVKQMDWQLVFPYFPQDYRYILHAFGYGLHDPWSRNK